VWGYYHEKSQTPTLKLGHKYLSWFSTHGQEETLVDKIHKDDCKSFIRFSKANHLGASLLSVSVLYFISVLGQAADREFLIRVSYMEIYNEEINDLLTLGSEKLPIHESLEVNVINDYSFSSYYLIDSVRIYIVATARCVCVRPAGRDC
jgi:hypothetical protein